MSFIFGSLLDRSTTPAFSPPPPPLAPLAFASLSPLAFAALSLPHPYSSPTPPLPAWWQWRGRVYWCADVRLPGQPKDGWRGSVDVIPVHDDEPATSGHQPTWIQPLRPSREQLLHSRQRLVLLEPPTPSLSSATKSAIYSSQCGLERHALIVHL
jgi:hypothetical protein